MTLVDLADELAEVRRYVRSHPEYVRGRIGFAVDRGSLKHEMFQHPDIERIVHRLSENIFIGTSRILSNPKILEGYLDGAVHEIRQHAERQRKETNY